MWYEFKNGSNPYIAMTTKRAWEMFKKYDMKQISEVGFTVYDERKMKSTYQNCKALLRDIAVEWSLRFGDFHYSYSDLLKWQDLFEYYGKRYGLLREFRENGIC